MKRKANEKKGDYDERFSKAQRDAVLGIRVQLTAFIEKVARHVKQNWGKWATAVAPKLYMLISAKLGHDDDSRTEL